MNDHVCHATILGSILGVLRDPLVVVVGLWEFCDDVPGVQETRYLWRSAVSCVTKGKVGRAEGATYISEHTKKNIDQRVCGADTALDPN